MYWAYTNFALPYHIHSFPVGQIVPYLQAICVQENNCILDAYKDWAFTQQALVLSQDTYSYDAFVAEWSQMVATEFNLDLTTV